MTCIKHKWVCVCSIIYSLTFLCNTVIINWSCQLMPENMMTLQCIIKNYCHCCCGMVLSGLSSAHKHWMWKVSKCCLFCINKREGRERSRRSRGKNMIPGTLLPRTNEKTTLLKSPCKDWACTHCQCSWCLCPQSEDMSCGYLLPPGMCIHWSSLAQKNDFTYAATQACHCYLTVEAEVDLRPLHADFRWQSGAGTGFSPCPSCFSSQYLSISAPKSYFVHLPPMLYDPTNWHHISHWPRALHAEWHHKHDT